MNADSPGVLDEAWAAAEAALPEGGVDLVRLARIREGQWTAQADWDDDSLTDDAITATGPTPADALRALAAALAPEASREVTDGG